MGNYFNSTKTSAALRFSKKFYFPNICFKSFSTGKDHSISGPRSHESVPISDITNSFLKRKSPLASKSYYNIGLRIQKEFDLYDSQVESSDASLDENIHFKSDFTHGASKTEKPRNWMPKKRLTRENMEKVKKLYHEVILIKLYCETFNMNL